MNIFLSALSGSLLALAFPKFDLYWIAWIALIPFFLALGKAKDRKEIAGCGLCFGLFFFGVHLFWVTTLFRFAGWWIGLGWAALVLYQTLFILLFVALISKFRSARIKVVLIPVIWTAVEWLRAWGPFGVTGGDVGYSQVQLLPLIQIAYFTSVYGVSFLIVFFNAALAHLIYEGKKWFPLAISLILIVAVTLYGNNVMHCQSSIFSPRSSLRIALIQPNIDQMDKMNYDLIIPTFNIQENMTRQAKAEVVIWPETAVFSYLLDDPVLFPRLKRLAVENNTWLILGTPYYEKGRSYNSIISLSPSGEVVSRYDKQQLVPFGEYLPFRPILYPLLKGVGYYEAAFTSNPQHQPVRVKDREVAAAICFESVFPQLIRQRVKNDPAFILLVTNDAWFGNSSALYFHLNAGVFRAIENRKYFVQVGNTGFSAIIDPQGRILKRSKVNQREILNFEIPLP